MSDILLISSDKSWKTLLEVTGEKSSNKPTRNRRLQDTFRGWVQWFLLVFFSVVIVCIAMKAFQDLIKERVEMREKDLSHMSLLQLALPDN